MIKVVINIYSQTSQKRTHFIVCFLFFFFTFPLLAANEYINGFKLVSCSSDSTICTKLFVSKTVERSFLSSIYSFAEASVEIQNKRNNSVKTYNTVEGGYYDPTSSEIILRNVTEINGGEMLIKLKDGQISKYLK